MAPTTPPFINPSLRTNGGDDGAAGALASATSAEKKQGSRAPRGPKVSNNFDPVPARRNPARGAKSDGGVAESEAAGGTPRKKPQNLSPRKKPRGEEVFLLRIDRGKAIAKQGRKEAITLEDPQGNPQGNPDERTEAGRPKEWSPKTTTKAPPVTQEVEGVDNPDEEEEELYDEDIEDNVGPEGGFIAHSEVENKDGGSDGEDPAQGEDRAHVAAGDASARRWTDDVAVRARAALAWEPRGHPPPNVVRPDQPYDVAARALADLRDNKPYRNPRLVRDHKDLSVARSTGGRRRVGAREAEDPSRTKVKTTGGLFAGTLSDNGMESDEEANSEANPPQVSTALFGSTTTPKEARPISRPPPPPSVDGVVWLSGSVRISH